MSHRKWRDVATRLAFRSTSHTSPNSPNSNNRRRPSHRLAALGTVVALAAASLTFVASPASAFTDPPPPFHECPAVGNATGCAVLLVFEPDGSVSVLSDPNSGNPYDGDDDTEIGVLNESGTTIPNVTLSSHLDIFGFDGDGPCSGEFPGTPAGCPFDPTGYAGPGVTYSGINSAKTTGVVNFAKSCTGNTAAACTSTSGLVNADSAFFALEENLTGASITIPKATPAVTTTPSESVPVGGAISDSALLSNGRVPTGDLTFTLFGPGDTTCQTPITTLSSTVDGNGAYDSGSVQATAPGVYTWEVSYAGDSNNTSAGPAACGTETVQVTPQILTGRGYGLAASASALGLQLLTINPTPDTGSVSTTLAETVAPPCVASLSGLINAGTLCAKVVTSLLPSASDVQASVNNTTIGITGLPVISVGAVQSQSSITCTSEAGSTTIAYLSVGGVVVISKPTVIAPNTRISVLGISLTLNEQIATPGVLTVNAVHVQANALGLSAVTANVVIASSTSDISNCP